ncbi:MAG: thioredoxin domain-containing protein [Alphaproteobacteria bacterium]
MTRNQLDGETSPYLLQHRDNPVHWRPWGPAAFADAAASDRPILLSIGYAACHWCHVMAHESFEDAAIAGLMNELFVNVKVDREERPDVDAIYMNALGLMGQPGGWPLTMFLTPKGEPFWGGTYFPPEARYGRPGFPDILRRVAEIYRDQPETIAKNTTALTEALGRMARPDPEAPSDVQLHAGVLDQAAAKLAEITDPATGGIGGAPKFPQAYALETMWRAWLRNGDEGCRDAVLLTLTHMSQGGIYDHLGGGFARYATDDKWLVPHFEKMLYDNAQLLSVLTLVWQSTGEALFAQRARETVEWTLREMIAPDGGFAATLDADSEGVEGKFYVWGELEVNRVLDPDAALFKQVYDVSPGGNWEGANILNRSAHLELLDGDTEAKLAVARRKLFEAREPRVRPGWDDKLLADWNGLMIAAMAEAGLAFGEPDWIAQARGAFDVVIDKLERDGRLLHSYRAGKAQHRGMLDDYANMARGALALYEITGADDALAAAQRWVAVLDARFWDEAAGGYFVADAEATDLIARQRHCNDNAIPAGNGTMTGVLTRLWYLTGEAAYRERADALFAAFAPDLGRNFIPMTTYLNGFDLMVGAVQVVLVGDDGTLMRAVGQAAQPNRVLQSIAANADLPAGHPAAGKGQVDGNPTAYVCVGTQCSLPLTDAGELTEMVRNPEGLS